jgi:response regulator RpfG family c-di-GMP phosphodiesterase
MSSSQGDRFFNERSLRSAKEILKLRPNMPAILCSGFDDKIDDKKAAEIGIRQYIEKA